MKKFLSMLLALLMIAVSVAACGDPADSTDTNGPSDSAGGTGGVGDGDAAANTKLEIPDTKFDGVEFVILTPTVVSYNYTLCDFDEPSDDPYDNAIYERNMAVEELLGITISEENGGLGDGTYQLFKTAVDSNSKDYDICFNEMSYSSTAVGAGMCYTIEELPYIDLDKDWWNDDCTEQLAIGKQDYMIA